MTSVTGVRARTPGTIPVPIREYWLPLKGIWVFSAFSLTRRFPAPGILSFEPARCPLQPPSNVSTDGTVSLSCGYKKAGITTTKIVARHSSPSK
jgi:hypothetical protein